MPRSPLLLAAITLVAGLLAGYLLSSPPAASGEMAPDAPAAAAGPGFTYQGRLDQGGTPYSGDCDFEFRLFDALANGNQLGSAEALNNVPVDDGLFTVELNSSGAFGPDAFSGEARWLEIRVRCPAGSTGIVILEPRQPLTPAPLAHSLRPGALISGTLAGEAVLGAENHDLSGGIGLRGWAGSQSGYGVAGFQNGYAAADNTFWESGGIFGGRNGVLGLSKASGGYAVFGLHAGSGESGWAGRFRSENADGVWISTPAGQTGLSVSGGSKNAAVPTESGYRLLYSEESSEVWFTDYGFGQIDGSMTTVTIDPTFAETVNLEQPYHVFLQPYGNAALYVTGRTPTSFEVHLAQGEGQLEFSYRLVATRLGFEGARLEPAPWENDQGDLPAALTTQE